MSATWEQEAAGLDPGATGAGRLQAFREARDELSRRLAVAFAR